MSRTKSKETPVAWIPYKSGISQVYSSGLEYAFLSKDNKQITPWVFCKDFFQDAIFGHLNQKRASIYGFSYDPKVDVPLCMESTRMLIANKDETESFVSKVEACVEFMNQIETKLKMKKTIFTKCVSPIERYAKGGVFLLESSKRWMHAPPMISLYTLLVRVGLSHTKGNSFESTLQDIIDCKKTSYQSSDRSFVTESHKALKFILNHGDRKVFKSKIKDNYPEKISINSMHNYCGIVSYSKECMKSEMPHWYALQTTSAWN